jgi:threonine/homoserine/homoserine lactone efflux protein
LRRLSKEIRIKKLNKKKGEKNMELSWLLPYILVSVTIVLIPGQDMLFVLTQSLSSGQKAGLQTVAGSITGTVFHTLLASFGLSVIFASSLLAFNILKIVGVIYLLYLAFQAFREKNPLVVLPHKKQEHYFRKGMIMNLSNPKCALFFLTFLPQFVRPELGHMNLQMLLFGFIFIIETLIIFSIIAFFASKLGQKFIQSLRFQHVLKYTKGTVFGLLGISLLFSSR